MALFAPRELASPVHGLAQRFERASGESDYRVRGLAHARADHADRKTLQKTQLNHLPVSRREGPEAGLQCCQGFFPPDGAARRPRIRVELVQQIPVGARAGSCRRWHFPGDVADLTVRCSSGVFDLVIENRAHPFQQRARTAILEAVELPKHLKVDLLQDVVRPDSER